MMRYYVVDEGWGINVFPSSMFDNEGRYFEDPNINLADMDVIATFNNSDRAWDYAEKMQETLYE